MLIVSMDNTHTPAHSHPSAGPGSQIRSRVTVVCAECKRLKLKCDRRTPCSSCLKRDTVSRCTYSAAAAEKIDVQSLHNRVLVLEAQLAQLSSGRMKLTSHDHALLAVGASGSSVLVPLDDVAGIWLEDLDLGHESGIDLQPAFPDPSSCPEGQSLRRTGSSPQSNTGSPQLTSMTPSLSHLFCSLGSGTTTSVTPMLLALLPAAPQRPALIDLLGSVLRMHPSLNFPHFRARINAMFSDGSSPEEIGIGPSRTNSGDKPTLSFFAAAAAGFALALQCMPFTATPARTSSPHNPPSPTTQPPTVASLLALSANALKLAEDTAAYDLDFLHALILRCLCMLHDGMPRVSQAVFANVGKMVNIARMMGLARDPDEFSAISSSKYTLWDAEMRRRMWWDVFYYDLFVSDCMGLPPLISDDQHTCRMPSDVDEDAFVPNSVVLPQPVDHPSATNFSYFLQKCKLAQLVKNMKKRSSPETSSSSSGSTPIPSEPSLDTASQAESEIQQYLSDLPPAFKLDVDNDSSDPDSASASPRLSPPPVDHASPHLIVQRCELFTLAHQLVLKLFHPFLRRPNVRPPHNAMVACINATHAIIQASKIARGVWNKQCPPTGANAGTPLGANIPSSHSVFYPFARQLFDATIIAAHVVIRAPQSVFAKVALDDVRTALEVLRDPAIATGRGRSQSRGGVEGCPSEAVHIVEMMVHKAEIAKRNVMPVAAGTKRKHDEVEASLGKGFWLPYVGTGVATEGAPNGAGGTAATVTSSRPGGPAHGSPRTKFSDKPFTTENQGQHRGVVAVVPPREREKERKYPVVGVRNRNSGLLGDRNCPPGAPHARREPSVPRQQPPAPSGDPGGYARSTAPGSTAMQQESMRSATGEFSLTAPYSPEDTHMTNMTVSSTPSTFTSQSQSHSYSTASFQPASVSGSHQPVYDSSSYGSESTTQPVPQPFYVSYQHQQPAPPPPQSTYQPMNAHSHSQHPHLDITPMTMLQNQTAMAAPELKQEEGTKRQDSHANGSPFGSPNGWTDVGVPARFPTQTPWDHRYSY